MAAVLANWGGYYSQRVYLSEARRLGLKISPPHINHSSSEFSVSNIDRKLVLFMGLNQVRELTGRTQARILKYRPFPSLMDFITRVDPRPIEVENLIRAGSLEGLGSIPDLLKQLKQKTWRAGQMPLFEFEGSSGQDWSPEEKAAAQEELLGVSVSIHPLELYKDRIASTGALSTVDAASRIGQRVRVIGIRQMWRRVRTSEGGFIYLMSLEDLEGMLDVVISNGIYRRNRVVFSDAGPYLLEGRVEFDPEKSDHFLRAEHLWRLGPTR